MNYTELNEYIKNYLENDKTGRAIMLTSPWGTGKSFYIQETLVNYLKVKDGLDGVVNRCIVVSLYGVKSLAEINKSVYLQARAKFLSVKSEKLSAGKIVAKSIVNGVASFFNVNLNMSEKDLQNLYKSIDLTGRLLIFEDIERTQIDLIEFMGYVNNLTEQDGVKVLLVANEKEIIKYKKDEKGENVPSPDVINKLLSNLDEDEQETGTHTEQTEEYFKIKEKTVSDTIKFKCDFPLAVKQITEKFGAPLFCFNNKQSIDEIIALFGKNMNLRTYMFACQKAFDVFEKGKDIINSCDLKFKKSVFYGIILFSQKIKNGKKQYWDGDNNLSITLGNSNYPLYRFCYDYIQNQHFDCKKIKPAAEAYKELRMYDTEKSNLDKDLQVLYSWYVQTEQDVKDVIKKIETRLKKEDDIAFIEYGNIALNLIAANEYVKVDISNCKQLLIKNLKGKYAKVSSHFLLSPLASITGSNNSGEYIQLKNDMLQSLKQGSKTDVYFSEYKPENLSVFCHNYYGRIDEILNSGTFLSNFDIDKLAELITSCTSMQINMFRNALGDIYSVQNLDTFHSDLPLIFMLETAVRQKTEIANVDAIIKMNLNKLADGLKNIRINMEKDN